MKRTPLKRIGKVGRANAEARAIIAAKAEELELIHCEAQLVNCLWSWPLAPAHRHKRAWYKGDVALLSDYKQWIAACQNCHDQLEVDPELTETVFLRLRGQE